MSVNMESIDASFRGISDSFAQIADSLDQLAKNGRLEPEQAQQLENIMANVDYLVNATRNSVDALPVAVQRSREVLGANAEQLVSDIKFWFLVAVAAIILVLVVALASFYWFVLRPLQSTVLEAVGDISGMAKAMENTSKSLEIINQTHQEIVKLSSENSRCPQPPG
jgi:methyl-accepting chemotaxis protein